jgi:hypothetical protein
VDEIYDIQTFEIAVSPLFWQSKHEATSVANIRNQSTGSAIERKGIPHGEQESEHYLESGYGRVDFGHDKDESIGNAVGRSMNGNFAFNLDQCRLVDQRFRLRVNGIRRKGILDRGNRLGPFCDFFALVKLQISLQHR